MRDCGRAGRNTHARSPLPRPRPLVKSAVPRGLAAACSAPFLVAVSRLTVVGQACKRPQLPLEGSAAPAPRPPPHLPSTNVTDPLWPFCAALSSGLPSPCSCFATGRRNRQEPQPSGISQRKENTGRPARRWLRFRTTKKQENWRKPTDKDSSNLSALIGVVFLPPSVRLRA
jgi:hypothetical protein